MSPGLKIRAVCVSLRPDSGQGTIFIHRLSVCKVPWSGSFGTVSKCDHVGAGARLSWISHICDISVLFKSVTPSFLTVCLPESPFSLRLCSHCTEGAAHSSHHYTGFAFFYFFSKLVSDFHGGCYNSEPTVHSYLSRNNCNERSSFSTLDKYLSYLPWS